MRKFKKIHHQNLLNLNKIFLLILPLEAAKILSIINFRVNFRGLKTKLNLYL